MTLSNCRFSSLVDLRERQGCTSPPLKSKLFQFHVVFLGKKLPSNSFSHPPFELAPPAKEILDPPLFVSLNITCIN